MMDLRTLHSDAMDLAEKAMIARAQGHAEAAKNHLAEALRKEEKAARLAVENGAPEPTRTILLKSAAHLAVDAGEIRLAERLIGTALAGDPPEELVEELRSAFEEIGFHRHLDLRGVELQHNDLQMVMVGDAIAPGMVASDQFIKRVESFQSLIYRTSECDQGIEYRERGDPKQEIEKPLQMYVSVPRAASFAVSLKVASQKGQAEFSFAESSVVVDHLMTRLGMFERAEYEALSKEIPKKEYFDNFVRLATELAPDGKLVKMVGFTTQRGSVEKRIEMRRSPKADGKLAVFVPSNERRPVKGKLFYFNENNEGTLTIKLRTDDGFEYRLKADPDMLTKASKYVGRKSGVTVTGVQTSRATIEFDEIKTNKASRAVKKTTKSRR